MRKHIYPHEAASLTERSFHQEPAQPRLILSAARVPKTQKRSTASSSPVKDTKPRKTGGKASKVLLSSIKKGQQSKFCPPSKQQYLMFASQHHESVSARSPLR